MKGIRPRQLFTLEGHGLVWLIGEIQLLDGFFNKQSNRETSLSQLVIEGEVQPKPNS